MTTNGNTAPEDADMADSDGGKVVTMMDVLQEQQEFEEDANAVLGASDDKNCTYTKGYIKRQAIYACLTCCFESKDDPSKRAGVCLACSLTCHEHHELIELYTKRHFRCDCGNPKFDSHPCQFTSNKDDLNEENKYNQNFSGLYCVCQRPYPDPEIPEEDEMIQCIICEDWLHSSHLEATVPGNDQYSEMICKACMETNNFLHDYSKFAVNVEDADVEITVNGVDANIVNETIQDNDFQEKVVNGTGDTTMTKENKPDSLAQEGTEVVASTIEDKGDKKVDSTEDKKDEIEEGINSENKNLISKIDETESNKVDAGMDTDNQIETQPVKDDINMATKNQIEIEPVKDANMIADSHKAETKMESPDLEKKTDVIIENSNENMTYEHKKDNVTSDLTLNDNKTVESDPSKSINDVNVNSIDDKSKPKEALEFTDIKDSSQKETDELKNKVLDETVNTETKVDQDSSCVKPNETEKEKSNEDTESDDLKTELASTKNEIENKDNSKNKIENIANDDNDSYNNTNENKRKLSIEDTTENMVSKKPKIDEKNMCIRPKGVKKIYKGATFWASDFRQKLCTCNECLLMYKALSVLYLIDPEDTVTAYETLGMEKDGTPASQYEKGLEALSSLDRVQQINALTEYNKMKDKLLDFLKSFKDRKEIVKEADIKAFFAGMKPKREPDGVYFCR